MSIVVRAINASSLHFAEAVLSALLGSSLVLSRFQSGRLTLPLYYATLVGK